VGVLSISVQDALGSPDGIVWTIQDDGVGTAEVTRARVFEAFFTTCSTMGASAEFTPAFLIGDIMMPDMTGVEPAIHFRKSHRKCKVLLFSGQASTADLLERARTEGYDLDLLSKPVHPADLLAKLRV
jgi:CheY-like chemotaxis protein